MIEQKGKQTVFEELKHWYTPFHVVLNHVGISPYEERVLQDIAQLSTEDFKILKEDLHRFCKTLECLYTS